MSAIAILQQLGHRWIGLEWWFPEKTMKQIVMLTVMVASLSGNALCQYVAEFNSYHSGKRYDFQISREQLLSTPPWLDGEPDPPLSARSAKDIATVYLSHLFKNSSEWSVGEIALSPVAERWVYLISFDPPLPSGCRDCMSMPFKIVVLMDGMAVPATKSRWNPAAPSQR